MNQRFKWDYPSQGLRFPRTMDQAFGPGARLHVEQPTITTSGVLYALAAAITVVTLIILLGNI